MGSREDLDIDDDFSEIYKAYTGPQGSTANNSQEKTTAVSKRSHAGSDEEEEAKDPNAVPTDFTSREAKFWEAKSKATERNWKKRKEEEMICKICGESGHFTQGCPSTLGANRKSQDFFERVPAREPHVKALFNEKVVDQIEKDIGCKIKIEEKFIIVSGKDRLVLKKGVDAVHKIKEDGERKGSSSSQPSRSRSSERRTPPSSRVGRTDSQRSNPSPHGASQYQNRFGRQEKVVEDRVHEDLQKISRGSPQAYGNDGARGRSSHSRSPAHFPYPNNSFNSYDAHGQGRARRSISASGFGGYKQSTYHEYEHSVGNPNYAASRFGGHKQSTYPEYEHSVGNPRYSASGFGGYKQSTDPEYEHSVGNPRHSASGFGGYKHSIDPEYEHSVGNPRHSASGFGGFKHSTDPEYEHSVGNPRHSASGFGGFKHSTDPEYEYSVGNPRYSASGFGGYKQSTYSEYEHSVGNPHCSSSGFGGFKQSTYPEYEHSVGNPHYSGNNLPMDTRGSYPTPADSYPSSRAHDTYGDFQRQRHNDYGKAYNRY